MNLPNHQYPNFHVISLPEYVGKDQSTQVLRKIKPMLNQSSNAIFLLDMAQVIRLDWSGVMLLMELLTHMRSYSGTLALVHVRPVVMAFLELTQTNQLIPVFLDEQTALADLRV